MRSEFEKKASKLIFGDEGYVPKCPDTKFEVLSKQSRMMTYTQLVQELEEEARSWT